MSIDAVCTLSVGSRPVRPMLVKRLHVDLMRLVAARCPADR